MKKILLHILCVLLVIVIWAIVVFMATLNGWLHQPIAKQKTTGAFLSAVDKEMDKRFTGNFAIALLKNGIVENEKFYSAGKPVDRNTVFQVASLSKWVSAVGMMKLVEEGKIDLDAPVSKYLTRWKLPRGEFNNDEVTVRRLLSHTAGLTDGLGYSGFETQAAVQSLEQSLTKAADADEDISGIVRVDIKPGTKFKYSGGGYTLLQLIVEEVSYQSFASYMKNEILDPLGMIHSTYVWDESSADALAEFYNSDGTKAKHYHYTALAATSLYTSLADLELFFQAHLTGKKNEVIGRTILKPETIRKMREPHGKEMGIAIWGLGTVLYAATDNDDFIIGHDGKSSPRVNTAIRLNPETGDGIIILTTGNPNIATKLASEWVFWKTGKVDTLLFPMLINRMIWIIGIGWCVITISSIIYTRRKRSVKM